MQLSVSSRESASGRIFRPYWTRLSDAAHAMPAVRDFNGTVRARRYTLDIRRVESPPLSGFSESRERITSILGECFYERAFRFTACARTITRHYRPYAGARVWHACSRVSFSKRLLRRRFRATLLLPERERSRFFLAGCFSCKISTLIRIMTYNTAGSFPIILIRRGALDRNCTIHAPPFFYCPRKPLKTLIRRPNAELTCHSRYVRSHAEESTGT